MNAQEKEAYIDQSPESFLAQTFKGATPKPKLLWITKSLKPTIRALLDHDLGVLRLRYWQRDNRSVWILNEIGKEKLITTGIVVNGGQIERIKVLVYRESRGYEVRYPFFTDQFKGLSLQEGWRLNKNIDGISGATLSVRALTRLAGLALFLHQQIKP